MAQSITISKGAVKAGALIALLTTLANLFTAYLPVNVSEIDINKAQFWYSLTRFVGGTFIGALLAIIGGPAILQKGS